MDITITDINGSLIYVLPHVPAGIEHGGSSSNETLETLSGQVRLLGDKDLMHVSWSAILPVKKSYRWQKTGSLTDGYNYITFFESMQKNKLPVRVVITDKDYTTLLNSLMTIDNFVYRKDKAGDYTYTIELTEFNEDVWDMLNDRLANLSYYSEILVKTAAREALEKAGLL